MKTLLVLTLLVPLVGLGVWNSPKAVRDEGYSVVRSMKLTGKLLTVPAVMIDEAIEYQPVKADACPWAEYTAGRVKTADEIAKQKAEWAGEYGTGSLWEHALSSKSAPDGNRHAY